MSNVAVSMSVITCQTFLTLIMVKYVFRMETGISFWEMAAVFADLCAERGRPGIDHSRLCKQLQVIRGIAKFDFYADDHAVGMFLAG